ncbi:MAG: cbb3-type cytochrome c oxidase subunit 3 [Alphaproteobacteria bacterium]
MKQIFASADFGLVGLIFFFVFFCGILLWTLRPGAKKTYKEHGNIPFQEGEE